MSTPIALGFTMGVLAVFTACVLPFAAAVLGLGAARPGPPRGGLREALHGAMAAGAMAGLGFSAVILVAFAIEKAEVEVSDGVPILAVAAVVAVAALAVRAIRRGEGGDETDRSRAAVLIGAAYAVISLPGSLWMIQGAVELTAESRGTAGAILSIVLFCAGAFAAACAIALLAELCAAGARRLGTAGRVAGAVVAVAAAMVAALYWLPAVADGVAERGGATGDAIAGVAGEIGWFAASNGLVFAAILLGAALVALAGELRRPART